MSTFPIVENNVTTTLRNPHQVEDGVIQVALGSGERFGDTFPIRVTCQRSRDNAVVIFLVTDRLGDDLVVSVIENTDDITLSTGDVCEMRLTAGAISELQEAILYSTDSPTKIAVGGVPVGSVFTNALVRDVINQMLYGYLIPVFDSFVILGATDEEVGDQEVGQTVLGPETFTWTTTNSSSVAPTTIAITNVTTNTVVSGLDNIGSYSVSADVTHNTPINNVWSISAQDVQNRTFSQTYSVSWMWLVYHGSSQSQTLTGDTVTGLSNKDLSPGFANTYAASGAGYQYFCFPDSYGGPSAFNNLSAQTDLIMADSTDDSSYSNVENGFSYNLVAVTNRFAITTNYRVYRSKSKMGNANIMIS